MNISLILAGGLGLRMEQHVDVPKQFYVLGEKPVLIHTLDKFEQHKNIDAICIVCLPTWQQYLRELLDSFRISKVRWIVDGGESRQQSVFNGLYALEKDCSPDSIILVHDGVRPFITSDIIDENINMAATHPNAMTGMRSTDTLVTSPNGRSAVSSLDRDSTFTIQTPQTYSLGYGLKQYRRALAANIVNTVNCCELFTKLSERVFIVNGLKTNIKLTTSDDIDYLKALYEIFCKQLGEKTNE